MTLICGFIVLRKPNENYEKVCEAPYFLPNIAPCINDIYYSGISRLPWYELEENYYAGKLPEDLIGLRDKIDKINQPYLDIKLLKDYDEAMKVLEYSNGIQNRNELAVVFSDNLSKMKGKFEVNLEIELLGFDILYGGYGSQIKEGIFKKPDSFADFVEKLNPNGLFDKDDKLISSYVQHYNNVTEQDNLEPMNNLNPSLFDCIEIGRIR